MKKALLLFLLLSVVIGSCTKNSKNSTNFKYEVNNVNNLSINAGDTAYMNVEVKLLEGNPGDVNLALTGLPPDVTATLSSAGSTPDYNTIITFVANKKVINGIFPLKLIAATLMGKKVYNFKLTVGGADTTTDTTHHDPFTYTVNNVGGMTVQQGGAVNKNLEVKLLTGTTENVSLALTGVPTGVTSSFSVSSGMPTFGTTLTFNAGATAVAGTYPIALKSTSSTGIQTYNFNLTVSSTVVPFNYTINGVGNMSIQAGNSGTLPLVVKLLTGTAEAVSLSVSGLPAGATSSFSAASGTPDFNSTLTVTTTASVAAGTYPITLKSTSANTTQKTFTFNLVVTGTTGGDCATNAAGTYTSQDSCSGTSNTSVVTKTGTDKIKITNLAGYLTYMIDANANINCTNHTITIPSQAIAAIPIPGAMLSGTGTFTNNTMTIHYSISILTYTITCKVDLTR